MTDRSQVNPGIVFSQRWFQRLILRKFAKNPCCELAQILSRTERLASRNEIKPAWLAGQLHAVFSAARPELLTVAADGALALWPQAALLAPDGAQPLLQWPAKPGRGNAALSPDGHCVSV